MNGSISDDLICITVKNVPIRYSIPNTKGHFATTC